MSDVKSFHACKKLSDKNVLHKYVVYLSIYLGIISDRSYFSAYTADSIHKSNLEQ